MFDVWHLVLISAVGALLALDRTVAFQFMVSRPIVSGPIIGLVLGHPGVGVTVGAMLELIWIGTPPLGGRLPPHECLAAVVTTAAVSMAYPPDFPVSRSLIVLGLLLAPLVARLGSILEFQLRRINVRLARHAQKAVQEGREVSLFRLNLMGAVFYFAGSFLFLAIFIPLTRFGLSTVHPKLSPDWSGALELMFLALPLIGITAALSSLNLRRKILTFSLFFTGGALLLAL
jgi:PTS system mannose-specific IIC component